MMSTIVSMTLALAMGSTGGIFHQKGGWVTPEGPGYGWGFRNGNPDGSGWWDNGTTLPLGSNRTPDYFFPRYYAFPPAQMFLPTYYNAYASRGQRFIPYANCGGWHPMGGPPQASATLPIHPYDETIGSGPLIQLPTFSGRVEAPPINPGGTGLTP